MLFFVQCKSIQPIAEQNKTTPQTENSILGKWKLMKKTGGIMGKEQIPNEIQIIEFTATEMITSVNGKEIGRSTYTLGYEITIHSQEKRPVIIAEGQISPKLAYDLQGDNLIITDNFYDGFSKFYTRLTGSENELQRK